MDLTSKKNWQKPELIVLVHGKPEETVLQACKGIKNSTGPGPKKCQNTVNCFLAASIG